MSNKKDRANWSSITRIVLMAMCVACCLLIAACGKAAEPEQKDMEPAKAEYDLDKIASSITLPEGFQPRIGIVLGSGLHSIANGVDVVQTISYDDLPVFPECTVEGHEGRFVLGYLEGVPVIVMDGRVHYYEGYSMEEVVTPIRIMAKLGASTVILTNSSGSMREDIRPGDLVCINDHIASFVPNPLIGQNDEGLGERFIDMAGAYDESLRGVAHETATELGIELKDGVYMQVTGPTFETPAEAEAYASLGADIVGMSTACETIVLRHMGVKVLGISCATNYCPNVSSEQVSHEEVQATASKAGENMAKLIKQIVKKLG